MADTTVSIGAGGLDKKLADVGSTTYADYMREHPYGTIACGEVAGSAVAAQLPDVACNYARIKACLSNVGNVYVGGAGVTKPDGTTDTTTGLGLAPGEDTGWLPIANLNKLYVICDNATDDLTYLALA